MHFNNYDDHEDDNNAPLSSLIGKLKNKKMSFSFITFEAELGHDAATVWTSRPKPPTRQVEAYPPPLNFLP